MPFFSFSNTNIQFVKKEIIWRRYIATKALPTTQGVKFINQKKFATVTLYINSETFVIYLAALDLKGTNMAVHPFQVA